jgi:hypothetical protein
VRGLRKIVQPLTQPLPLAGERSMMCEEEMNPRFVLQTRM